MTTSKEKSAFIAKLAKFLSGNIAAKSILLQVESQRANDPRPSLTREWADLRGAAGLSGWDDVEIAEKRLLELLS